MDNQFMVDAEGNLIPKPVPIIPVEEAITEEEPKHPKLKKDELDYLFEVPQPEDNDIYTADLVEVPEEEDLSDLVTVSNDDIMGEAPKPKKTGKYKKTTKRYIPPAPTSLGGMR